MYLSQFVADRFDKSRNDSINQTWFTLECNCHPRDPLWFLGKCIYRRWQVTNHPFPFLSQKNILPEAFLKTTSSKFLIAVAKVPDKTETNCETFDFCSGKIC